jgi:hypothetical protein
MRLNMIIDTIEGEGLAVNHQHLQNIKVLYSTWQLVSGKGHYPAQRSKAVRANMHTPG